MMSALSTAWPRPDFVNGMPRHAQEVIDRYRADGYWSAETIVDRFSTVAEANPERLAVVDETFRISYSELRRKTSAFAGSLRELGVSPGDIVTIQLPNWWEHIVAVLGTIEAGAVAAPVNIRVRGELEYVLTATQSKVVVGPEVFHDFSHSQLVSEMAPRLEHLRHQVLVRPAQQTSQLDFSELILRAEELAVQPAVLAATDAWEIMFTSGTTSRPKGVVRTHDNTIFTIRLLAEHYGILAGDGTDVALAVLPVSFVYAQYVCALGALLTGGTLVLQDDFDASATLELIKREHVTVLPIVPSMVPAFHQAVDRGGSWELSSLRIVAPAGEAVTRERKQECVEIFRCDVRECYGLAEVTMPLVQPELATWQRKLDCTGQVNPATEVRVIADDGTDVVGNDEGELLVRTPTLFPGYYRNVEATLAAIDEDGWFHTGDLVRSYGAGFFGIAGRRKDLIKRGGISVVPQDVEDALEAHPGVAAVAVFGLQHPSRGEIVCACVVPRSGWILSSEDLQSFLRGRIATFKIPERIELVDSLPVSGNGKILKSELAARLRSA